jgi:hypothetical protein
MSRNNGKAAGEKARQHVAMTHSTGFDSDADLTPARIPLLPLGYLE